MRRQVYYRDIIHLEIRIISKCSVIYAMPLEDGMESKLWALRVLDFESFHKSGLCPFARKSYEDAVILMPTFNINKFTYYDVNAKSYFIKKGMIQRKELFGSRIDEDIFDLKNLGWLYLAEMYLNLHAKMDENFSNKLYTIYYMYFYELGLPIEKLENLLGQDRFKCWKIDIFQSVDLRDELSISDYLYLALQEEEYQIYIFQNKKSEIFCNKLKKLLSTRNQNKGVENLCILIKHIPKLGDYLLDNMLKYASFFMKSELAKVHNKWHKYQVHQNIILLKQQIKQIKQIKLQGLRESSQSDQNIQEDENFQIYKTPRSERKVSWGASIMLSRENSSLYYSCCSEQAENANVEPVPLHANN